MAEILVSIVILTRNRKDVLLELLESLFTQSYKNFETIVVDNNSSDGTKHAVQCSFPNVGVISLCENIGCGGRNVGIQNANGEIIITLDDDILFNSVYELERLVTIFRGNNFDVLNFKVLDYYTKNLAPFNWYHPRSMERFGEVQFETDYISEGAVAFRRDVFLSVGCYHQDFFLGHEGIDLVYRLLDHGFTVVYSPNVVVLHKHSLLERSSWRGAYYDTRNFIWLFVRHYPLDKLITNVAFRLITTLAFALSRNQLFWYLKGVRDGVVGLPRQWKQRRPLHRSTFRRIKEIRKFQPGLLEKLKDFKRRREARSY